MGGLQAIISLTLVAGPPISGLAFDRIGVPAPYWIGALLATLALLSASVALLHRYGPPPAREGPPEPPRVELDALGGPNDRDA